MQYLIARFFLFGVIFISFSSLYAQGKPAYALFTGEGKEVSYKKMISSLSEADVVFFGELHNNAMAHWLELQILKDLHAERNNIVMGMEMFEADDQIVLNEYLTGFIEEKNFLRECKLWDNYKTDYRPLIEFARKKNVAVIATNVPRRYANVVYRKGLAALDSLTGERKSWMAPLPLEIDYTLSGYKAMIEGMGQHGSGTAENLVASQALKDATMAYFISKHYQKGSLFYHVNGAYHSQDREGIIIYLKKTQPEVKIITIHTAEQQTADTLDRSNSKGDFVFCIPHDMAKSY